MTDNTNTTTITAAGLADLQSLLQRDLARGGYASRGSVSSTTADLASIPRRLDALREVAPGDPEVAAWLALQSDLIRAVEAGCYPPAGRAGGGKASPGAV